MVLLPSPSNNFLTKQNNEINIKKCSHKIIKRIFYIHA